MSSDNKNLAIQHNILWLQNKVFTHPVWTGRMSEKHNLAEESFPLIPYLIRLNECGFYTICSQPSMSCLGYKNYTFNQLAFVRGVIEPKKYEILKEFTKDKYENICFPWDEPCKHENAYNFAVTYVNNEPQSYACGVGELTTAIFPHVPKEIYGWRFIEFHLFDWNQKDDKNFWETVVEIFKSI